jgi:HD-like signal output (HDOD) protein
MYDTPVDSLSRHAQLAAQLPTMPEVARRLLNSFDSDDLSLTTLAALIGRDPALSAKVLRLANSARYSPSRAISSLSDAAASLGLRTLRDLALSACISGAFPTVRGFDRIGFWRGNLAMAAYAQTIARHLEVDEDTAYIAGLTLRIGQMLMLMCDADRVLQVHSHSGAVDSLIGFEESMIGFSHPQLSARLASAWRFPPAIVSAFEAAADPLAAKPFTRLGACLRLASVITDARERGLDELASLLEVQGPLVAHLQLDLAWLGEHLPDHRLAAAGAEELLN